MGLAESIAPDQIRHRNDFGQPTSEPFTKLVPGGCSRTQDSLCAGLRVARRPERGKGPVRTFLMLARIITPTVQLVVRTAEGTSPCVSNADNVL